MNDLNELIDNEKMLDNLKKYLVYHFVNDIKISIYSIQEFLNVGFVKATKIRDYISENYCDENNFLVISLEEIENLGKIV